MSKEKRTIANSRQKAYDSFQKRLEHALGRQKKDRKKNPKTDTLTNLTKSVKTAGKKFHFFQFLFKKHTKTGRFGRKTAADQADTIQAMDTAEDTPFVLDPFQALQAAESSPGTVAGDFYQRVQQEMDLAEESDFERKQISQDEEDRMTLKYISDMHPFLQKRLINQYSQSHDASKEFIPDEEIDASVRPDSFELELAVMKPHELYLEYTQTKTAMKKKKLGGSVDENEVLLRILEKDASFQDKVKKKREANPAYDPRTDTDENSPVFQALQNTTVAMREVGHSFVRMIAKGQGRQRSKYSFGFWPLGKAIMGTVTEGEVRNPDTDSIRNPDNIITKKYPLKYPDYLRAAARIRGIMGTSRSYSFTGYNCTSFAVEVAQAAGISISDKDSSIDIPTLVSRSQRVEMPAALQRFIERENQKDVPVQTASANGLSNNPLFCALYDYYGEQIPEAIRSTLQDALQSVINTTPSDTLKQMLPANEQQADAASIRAQFFQYALSSEEGLQKALGLGISLPEYSIAGNKLLLQRVISQKTELLSYLSQSQAVMDGFTAALDAEDITQYHAMILNKILEHTKKILGILDKSVPIATSIRSAAEAMHLKEAVMQRQKAFKNTTGVTNLSEYFIKCCTDENILAEIVYLVQIS